MLWNPYLLNHALQLDSITAVLVNIIRWKDMQAFAQMIGFTYKADLVRTFTTVNGNGRRALLNKNQNFYTNQREFLAKISQLSENKTDKRRKKKASSQNQQQFHISCTDFSRDCPPLDFIYRSIIM